MQGGRDDDDVAYDEDDDDDVVADEEDDDDESCGSDDDYDINDHGQPYWAQPFFTWNTWGERWRSTRKC